MSTQIVTQVAEDGREVYVVRHQDQLFVVVFHDDPGEDFAVTPDGRTRTDIWDPHGPYRHPRIPDALFDDLESLISQFS